MSQGRDSGIQRRSCTLMGLDIPMERQKSEAKSNTTRLGDERRGQSTSVTINLCTVRPIDRACSPWPSVSQSSIAPRA